MQDILDRVLVSFDDLCPYQCKHCYTLDIPRDTENRNIETIINSIAKETFDIVYVSQRRDNFVNPDKGLELCEKIFEKYKCNLFLITRNTFDCNQIKRLKKLKSKMAEYEKSIFVGVSVFATTSYSISENPNLIPSPYERIEFLKYLSKENINTLTIIRPVFPSSLVPLDEIFEIIDLCESFNSCIVSSGLAVNDNILWRLQVNQNNFKYVEDMDYLNGVMEGELHFIDVQKELQEIKEYCLNKNLPFFEHTMPALNFLRQRELGEL